jgi:ABC-type glycerol-3-phosphate transport system substrate-binding protein
MRVPKNLFMSALCVFVLLLGVGVSAQDEPIELRYTLWIAADSPQLALFNELAAEYSQQNPNVTVTFEPIAYGDVRANRVRGLSKRCHAATGR